MTTTAVYSLVVTMVSSDGEKREISYDAFSVGDASSKYELTLGTPDSPADFFVLDSFSTSNGAKFSAKDADNDDELAEACADLYDGPGW